MLERKKMPTKFWQENLQKRHQQRVQNNIKIVGFEVFTAVTMKNAVFRDVAPRRYCVN
jgi:hypothetical protein